MVYLFKENVCFYIYFEYVLVSDSISYVLVYQFCYEMDEIGKVVFVFFGKYGELVKNLVLVESFFGELGYIGEVLVWCICNEEDNFYLFYLLVY